MTVTLLLISDGRDDYLRRTSTSAAEMLVPGFDDYVWVNDADHQLGFAGAIRHGWSQIKTDYVFHLEQDFTFNEPICVADMISVLEAHPYLAQLALLRQPWNDEERAAGGVVALHPESYEPIEWFGHRWLEHTRHFTTNPCVYPRWVVEKGWPDVSQSEGHFGLSLFEDPLMRCGYWGHDLELVTHIGAERAGVGY